MTISGAIKFLEFVEPAFCLTALAAVGARRQLKKFLPLSLYLITRVTSIAAMAIIMEMYGKQIPKALAYKTYFYTYWASYALEAVLSFFVIYSIYRLAMAPLPGLQRLGTLMFRWAGGIALAIAVATSLGPHEVTAKFVTRVVTQLQLSQSIITLCLLLFVCLTARPMGLSARSKVFGVSLGLGMMATSDLVSAAWIPSNHLMNSGYSLVNGSVICAALLLWTGYFALPEPRRRMIVLPTTSPFLRWNQISLALGDEPGFVALGEVSPDMFAPAEVEIMRRASIKMRQQLAN